MRMFRTSLIKQRMQLIKQQMWPSEPTCRSNEKTQNGKQLITCVTSSSGQSIVYALISDKLHYSNPL